MNLANKVTLIRIFLAPVIMFVLLNGIIPYGAFAAAAIFILATLTDKLDGYIARKQQNVTRFGEIMDPIADKILISAAIISLVQLDALSPWIAFLIISREFAVTGLRLIAVEEGRDIKVNTWGKIKTVAQIIMVIVLIIELAVKSGPSPPASWFQSLVYIYPATIISSLSLMVAVFITLISGIFYFYEYIRFMKVS